MTYTVSTLAKLFSLDDEKLREIIQSEGFCVYDSKTDSKIGYLPTLDSYFRLETEIENTLKQNVKKEWFSVDTKNEIMTIVSLSDVPVTAYLFSQEYDELMLDSRSSILITNERRGKIFIADDYLIRRLSQGVSKEYKILPFVEGNK